MKRPAKIIISIIVAWLISMPVVYASGCDCDNAAIKCHHEASMLSMQKKMACHPITPTNNTGCDCPRQVPCEFTKQKPSVLMPARAVLLDSSDIKIQWVMPYIGGRNDFELSNHTRISSRLDFFQRSWFFDKIYLTCESFLC
jgi:hypothetical protein